MKLKILQLLDKNHNKIEGLNSYIDLKIESVLSTGDKTLSFLYPKKLSKGIENEGYIQTKEQEYVIKEVSETNEWNTITATLNLEELEGNPFESFDSTEQTILKCMQDALAGSGWTVNIVGDIVKKRTVRKTNSNSLQVLEDIRKTYLVEMEFNTLNKIVNVYEKIGSYKGCYFMDCINLRKLDVTKDSYDFYTRIVAVGSTNEDTKTALKVIVTNNEYSSKAKTLLWKDERYTVEESLREDAVAKLKEISKPKIMYEADINDLANMNEKYKNVLEYSLGDTVLLIDKEKGIKEKQRIVKITECPYNPDDNTCELSNTIYSFEDILRSQQATEDTVTNITMDNGTISPDAIKQSLVKLINVDVQNLNAVSARIGELFVNQLKADVANVATGIVGKLLSQKIETKDLVASNIKFNIAEGGSMSLLDLLSQFVSSENLQALHLTSDNVVIDEAVIKDLIASHIAVSDLIADFINTSKLKISSADGGMVITGNTQQFKDKNGKVRLQLGKDAEGNFTFILVGEDGTTALIDEKGITKNAIPEKVIVNDMVDDNAGIKASKLDIESLFDVINNDGTHTLNSSIVKLNGTEQVIDVAFKKINSSMLYNQAIGTSKASNITISTTETDGKANVTHWLTKVLSNKMNIGDKVKVSFDIKGTNLVCKDNTNKAIFFQGSGNVTGWNNGAWNSYAVVKPTDTITSTIDKHCEYTFTLSENHIKNVYWLLYLRVDRIDGDFTVSNIMVQIEEPFVDFWTKSIWDEEEVINTLQTKLEIEQGKIEQLIEDTTIITEGQKKTLKDAYNETKSTIDGTVQTVSNMETKVDSLNLTNLIMAGGGDYLNVSASIWGKTNFVATDMFVLDGSANNKWYRLLNTSSSTSSNNGAIYVTNVTHIKAPSDKKISISFRYYCNDSNGKLDGINNIRMYILQEHSNSGNFYDSYKMIELDKTTAAKLYKGTFELNSNCTRYMIRFDLYNNVLESCVTTAFRLKDIMVVNGSIPSSEWSPSFADLQVDINGIEQRTTKAEEKITDEGFSFQVQRNQNRHFNVRYIRDYCNGNTSQYSNLCNWMEIQAYSNIGTNLALNKTVTSNVTVSNLSCVTDGNYTDTTKYANCNSSTSTVPYIQIDLGQVYSNIDEIKVWHYYKDGRKYKKTKTEVSADGTNWITLFDSSVSGEYPESVYGHSIKVNNTSFNSSKVTINELGLHVKNGAIRIYNKDGTECFGADTSGSLNLLGTIKQKDITTGMLSVAIQNNGLEIYDWRNTGVGDEGDLVGGITAVENTSSKRGGCFIYSDIGNLLHIGYKDGPNHFSGIFEIDDTKQQNCGLSRASFYENITFKGGNALFADYSDLKFYGGDYSVLLGNIGLDGSNNMFVAGKKDFSSPHLGYLDYNNTSLSYKLIVGDNSKGTTVYGDFNVTGSKNRAVKISENEFKFIGMNAYETSSPYFGDIMEAKIPKDGLLYIPFDEKYLKTVNTKYKYQVCILGIYGNENMSDEELKNLWCRCIKREKDYFVLKGSPGALIGIEVKALQKNYEMDRLKNLEICEKNVVNYTDLDKETILEKVKNESIEEMSLNYYDDYLENLESEMLNYD